MSEKKNIDKKPIKDLLAEKDAFLTSSERIQEYFFRHTKGFVIGAVTVAVIIIGTAVYLNLQKAAEEKASLAYEGALQMMAAGQETKSVVEALEKVRAEHGGRKAARMAGYTLASIYNNNGDTDQALAVSEELLRSITPAEQSLKPILLYNIGGLYEVKRNYDLAAKSYATLLADKELMIPDFRQDVLLALGRVMSAAGKKDEAVKYYEDIINDHPDSLAAFMANSKLAELRGRPVPMPLTAVEPLVISGSSVPVTAATDAASPDENEADSANEASGVATADEKKTE